MLRVLHRRENALCVAGTEIDLSREALIGTHTVLTSDAENKKWRIGKRKRLKPNVNRARAVYITF